MRKRRRKKKTKKRRRRRNGDRVLLAATGLNASSSQNASSVAEKRLLIIVCFLIKLHLFLYLYEGGAVYHGMLMEVLATVSLPHDDCTLTQVKSLYPLNHFIGPLLSLNVMKAFFHPRMISLYV